MLLINITWLKFGNPWQKATVCGIIAFASTFCNPVEAGPQQSIKYIL